MALDPNYNPRRNSACCQWLAICSVGRLSADCHRPPLHLARELCHSYVGITALACIGYGGILLLMGFLFRNPIIPAAVLLAWEAINGILPSALQKMSILYYLQSLCPVPAPMDNNAPLLIRLMAAPAAPASRPGAILGLLLLTAFVLWIASIAVRRMQISYGAET